VGESMERDGLREAGHGGDDARCRERPLNVLDSTLSNRSPARAALGWLRSRVRPRIMSVPGMGEWVIEVSMTVSMPRETACILCDRLVVAA